MSVAEKPQIPGNDFLPVRPDWLALYEEDVLEPDLPIVDPHHHFWDHPGNRYLLPEFLEDTGSGHNIRATLFVECRAMYRAEGPVELKPLGETEFANGIAAMSASGGYGPTRVCTGIIGHVDLTLGAGAGDVFEAQMKSAGGRLCGIRHGSAWHREGIKATSAKPPEGLLLDRRFREGFANPSRLGLAFDAWLMHTQLDDVLDLARTFPSTTIVLDHVGGPIGIGSYAGKREEVLVEWSAAIRELARCDNVTVKLGGLGMHLIGFDFHMRDKPPSSEDLAQAWKPYIETCITEFGPERCMFESNFPVDKGTCSYQVLWNAFKRLAAGYSTDEKAALFSGTARKVYGLNIDGA